MIDEINNILTDEIELRDREGESEGAVAVESVRSKINLLFKQQNEQALIKIDEEIKRLKGLKNE